MSKPKGIAVQQQRKSSENGGPELVHGSNIKKGTQLSLDEFKYGFPADGLAVVFHKWWGSSDVDNDESTRVDGAEDIQEDKSKSQKLVDDGPKVSLISEEKPQTGNDESTVDPEGTVLLSRMRKNAAEEGRNVLKLGINREYGRNKLNPR